MWRSLANSVKLVPPFHLYMSYEAWTHIIRLVLQVHLPTEPSHWSRKVLSLMIWDSEFPIHAKDYVKILFLYIPNGLCDHDFSLGKIWNRLVFCSKIWRCRTYPNSVDSCHPFFSDPQLTHWEQQLTHVWNSFSNHLPWVAKLKQWSSKFTPPSHSWKGHAI